MRNHVVALAVLLLAAGCRPDGETDDAGRPPFAGQTITVAVPVESGFADVLEAERGEWSAQTGADLKVVRYAASGGDGNLRDALMAGGAAADVLIFPSGAIGELAAGGLIAPLGTDVLSSPRLEWREAFRVLREESVRWGKETTVAIPLGTPVMIQWYRRDLQVADRSQPPATWEELLTDAETLRAHPPAGVPEGWRPLAMPLGPSSRRVLFLSIAASFAKHRDNFSFFFKYDTMDPMIANAGFVRALETLVRLKEYAPADALEHDESDVRREFWRGAAALALTSGPTADDEFGDRPEGLVAGFAELPAAREVFNPYQQKWVAPADAEGNRVPLAGWRGWVASTSATPQGEKGTTAADSGAASLLARLATDPLGTQLVLAQRDFVLVRPGQHGGLAARLTERGWTPEEADAYATTLASALERPDAVVDLRIPGRERYNQALDEGLTRALSGEVDAPTALEEVARRWKGITEELGVEAQRNDYKASLGL